MTNKNIIINTKKSVLDDIYVISSKEFQERVWVRKEGPEVYDLAELMCNFLPFAELLIDNFKEYELKDVQKDLLKQLFRVVSEYNDKSQDMTDKEVVYDPEWEKIRKLAKSTHISLKKDFVN